MKNNINLDPGMTAFVTTVNDKLLRLSSRCKWLTIGLVICGLYTAWSVKHVKNLEDKVNYLVDSTTF